MKTTNYEISKQLYELGFNAETDFYWAKWNEGEPELIHISQQTPKLLEKIAAYDLETLIEALPYSIEGGVILNVYKSYVGYENSSGSLNFNSIRSDSEIGFKVQQNKSLADAAGRLLIVLIEDAIVQV